VTPEEEEVARYVLGYFGADGGWEAGGFTSLIMRAYQKADPGNKARLRLGFPELTACMDTVLNSQGGIKQLQDKLGK
jgi:hypothetical protein